MIKAFMLKKIAHLYMKYIIDQACKLNKENAKEIKEEFEKSKHLIDEAIEEL